MRQDHFRALGRHTLGEVDLADDAEAERATANAVESVRCDARDAESCAARRASKNRDNDRNARGEIALALAREAGKPIAFAKGEVLRAVSTFSIASEEATRRAKSGAMDLDVTPAGEGCRGFWRRVPRGPVIGISPFNFPLNLVAHKVAPALACGASIVLKPAPQTPLVAMTLDAIVRESGFPEHALARFAVRKFRR